MIPMRKERLREDDDLAYSQQLVGDRSENSHPGLTSQSLCFQTPKTNDLYHAKINIAVMCVNGLPELYVGYS